VTTQFAERVKTDLWRLVATAWIDRDLIDITAQTGEIGEH